MDIKVDLNSILKEIMEKVPMKKGQVFVIGCSTSEVLNKSIGTASSETVGKEIFDTAYEFLSDRGIFLACQACEHLNRALVVERRLAEEKNLEIVSVIPKVKAGGAFAKAAYENMKDPVMVEFIKADVGLDIGDTLIGMHIKHVAVPLRLSVRKLGEAHIRAAFSRPKLIGGERAVYK
ncbi:TIGR01440 family protein [Peptoniphilaceae bacterium SGI.131]